MSFGQTEKAGNHHPRRAHYKNHLKRSIHKRERQRVRRDVEVDPQYRKFYGWEL